MNMRVSPVICDSEAYSGVYLQLPSKSGKRREGKVKAEADPRALLVVYVLPSAKQCYFDMLVAHI